MTALVEIVTEPERAQALLDRTRLSLLEKLAQPGSAASLARELDLPRQRVNYHLRELENQKLVKLVAEKQRGSVTERTYRRTGDSYALSPAVLGSLAVTPEGFQDRFSAGFQVALASRTIRELEQLQRGAALANKRLPTFAAETEVRFASPEARAEFAQELMEAIAALVSKFHDANAENGRSYRVQLGAYPRPAGG